MKLSKFIIVLFSFYSLISCESAIAMHAEKVPGTAADGIINSRHNLARNGGSSTYDGTNFFEVCKICHPVHQEITPDNTPLWVADDPSSYKAYGSTISENFVQSVNGGSLACLACHDGVTTSDRLINTKNPEQAYMIDSGAQSLMSYFVNVLVPLEESNFRGLVIGKSLTNDHPIAIEYRPDRASLRDPSTVISSIDLNIKTMFGGRVIYPLVQGNNWSVRGAITNKATIQDLLKSNNLGIGTGNYVQCATCHDPHFKNQTNPERNFVSTYLGKRFDSSIDQHTDTAIDGLFLRRVGGNSDSGVCRTCHAK